MMMIRRKRTRRIIDGDDIKTCVARLSLQTTTALAATTTIINSAIASTKCFVLTHIISANDREGDNILFAFLH
jgi:hypothetical protein